MTTSLAPSVPEQAAETEKKARKIPLSFFILEDQMELHIFREYGLRFEGNPEKFDLKRWDWWEEKIKAWEKHQEETATSKLTERKLELVYKLQKAVIKRELLSTENLTKVQETIQASLCRMGISIEESYRVSADLTREAIEELRSQGL
jgi:hypothetical protein